MLKKIGIRTHLVLWILIVIILSSCANNKTQKKKTIFSPQAIPVIFETDIGNDIDDALALAMLNNYMDGGKINLLAVMYNKDNLYSGKYIDVVDTWYGHGNIPVGKVIHGKTPGHPSYTKIIADSLVNGVSVFKRSITDYSKIPDAVKLYRRILTQAKDTSVVIVSVGFSTNLSRLLRSVPDDISALNGTKLIKKKVKLLSMMAGCFDNSINKEYNIYNDVSSAYHVFASWPTEIIVSPFEVGTKILYPASSIEKDFSYTKHHPVADAYKVFMKMPYDRPCWDLTAVLYAVEADSAWFTLSSPGEIRVDTLTAKTIFTEMPQGRHHYLSVDSLQTVRIRHRLVTLVTARPRNIQ